MDERDGDVKPLLLLTMLSMIAARVTCYLLPLLPSLCVYRLLHGIVMLDI